MVLFQHRNVHILAKIKGMCPLINQSINQSINQTTLFHNFQNVTFMFYFTLKLNISHHSLQPQGRGVGTVMLETDNDSHNVNLCGVLICD